MLASHPIAAASLATRIDDAKPVLMVTADAGMRAGNVIRYKPLVDEALRIARHPPQRVIVVNRGLDPALTMQATRDLDYAKLRAEHAGARVPCEWVESSEPSYILYTSGTTGKPKGAVHCHASLKLTDDLYAVPFAGIKETDVVHSVAILFFAYGLGNAMTFALSAGATVILNPERPTPDGVSALLLGGDAQGFHRVDAERLDDRSEPGGHLGAMLQAGRGFAPGLRRSSNTSSAAMVDFATFDRGESGSDQEGGAT